MSNRPIDPNKAVDFRNDLLSRFYVEDGKLLRKVTDGKGLKAGTEAGCVNKSGYRQVKIDRKLYYTHRLIFLMHYGFSPITVDHIDGNKQNNSPENLRGASFRQNNCNTKIKKNNTSGVKGVYWSSTFNSWHVRVFRDGKAVVSKYFKSIDDAKAYRGIAAAIEYGDFSCEA